MGQKSNIHPLIFTVFITNFPTSPDSLPPQISGLDAVRPITPPSSGSASPFPTQLNSNHTRAHKKAAPPITISPPQSHPPIRLASNVAQFAHRRTPPNGIPSS